MMILQVDLLSFLTIDVTSYRNLFHTQNIHDFGILIKIFNK